MNIHVKTALGYVRRTPYQALAAISVLIVTFFVSTILAVLVYSSSKAINYFQSRPQIIAFLKSDVSTETIAALQKKISDDVRIKDVSFVSKAQALEIYKKATKDNPLLGELVNPSIFPASLEFSVTDISYAKNIIENIKKDPIVESVGFTASLGSETNLSSVLDKLRLLVYYVRISGIIFVGFLTLTSFLVLLVVISMRIIVRRDEIEILELIGATGSFIRAPIFLEAVFYSLIGVLTGWILASSLLFYLTPSIVKYLGDIPILPQDTFKFIVLLLQILGIELIVGSFISFAGAAFAVNRRRTRG